jgi:hypothetical protein
MAVEPLLGEPAAVVPAPRETPDAAVPHVADRADVAAAPTGRVTRPASEYWDLARAAWVVNTPRD